VPSTQAAILCFLKGGGKMDGRRYVAAQFRLIGSMDGEGLDLHDRSGYMKRLSGS
jgi:hypothetical protein